jgi:PncC family amidohydrolase
MTKKKKARIKMDDDLVRSIQQLCISQGWTVGLAESCTGGHLAARLTRLAGCSQYFLGSIVAYSNALKIDVLGVDAQTLAKEGAVSGSVVGQMAQGALELIKSDYCLAVSGIAGPGGGSVEKPVGTIWAALASREGDLIVWDFHLEGTRQEIIEKCVDVMLSQFWEFLQTEKT